MLYAFKFKQSRSDTITMNRIQFFVLTGLSSIAALLFIGHIALTLKVGEAQSQLAAAQQLVGQGNVARTGLQAVAVRIIQDSQRTGDSKLKDLMARNQISFTPSATNSTETPASPGSATH
jgi:hypothetical protein